MTSPNYELTANVIIGDVLHIKEMGFPTGGIPTLAIQRKCKNVHCGLTIYPKCSSCATVNSSPALTAELKSQVYTLGSINCQTKIIKYADYKVILFVALQSKDEDIYDVCISSDSLQLCRFLKARPDKELSDWHMIFDEKTELDINNWKFDLEVVLIKDGVNHTTAAPLLNAVLDDDNSTDVEMVGVDGSVRAHGCIMSAASPFFRAAFYGNFTEARDRRINVPDANVAALKVIKKYAYTSFVEVEPELLVMVLQLASRFMLPALARACAASLHALSPEDLIPLMHFNLKPIANKEEDKETPQLPQPQLLEMLSRIDNKLESLKISPDNGIDNKLETLKTNQKNGGAEEDDNTYIFG